MYNNTAVGLVLLALAAGFPAGAQELASPEFAESDLSQAATINTPFDAALADVAQSEREVLARFYHDRDFEPVWTAGGAGPALLETLANAQEHGLPSARYDAEMLEGLLAGDDPLQAEVAFSRAYLQFARDMTGGLLTPSKVDADINVIPDRPDDAELLARLDRLSFEEAVRSLEPAGKEYRALLQERERLDAVLRDGGWGAQVPEGPTLRLGDRDTRVRFLRDRLAALGYEVVQAGAGDGAGQDRREVFDAGVEAAVKAYQRDNGLVDDGLLGAATVSTLNASPEDRIGQILVSLERLRWMPEDLGGRYVWVNIPDYTVSLMDQGERVYHTRSVVGDNKTRTPEFSERMTHFVVNPTWYIPDSIAKRVYLPKLRQDPTVLQQNNMRLFTRSGTEIDPGLVNFAALGDNFPFRVRQNPSASNALGRVKFMFPNQFAIYLHDTPSRELFDRDTRAFSNGCVRLAEPFELAHLLLEGQVDDPEDAFQAWLDAGSERYVNLEEPIDVHIVYRTVWADADGVQYRRDVYGRDAKVIDALRAVGVDVPPQATAAAAVGRAG